MKIIDVTWRVDLQTIQLIIFDFDGTLLTPIVLSLPQCRLHSGKEYRLIEK